MADSKRTRAIVAALVIVALVALVAFLVTRCEPDSERESPSTEKRSEDTGRDDTDDTPAESGDQTSTVVVDYPSNPSSNGSDGTTGMTYPEYVSTTKEIATSRYTALKTTMAKVMAAIASGDSTNVLKYYAPDEGATIADANALTAAYPPILASRPSPTVDIYSLNSATVYVGFVVVDWRDGGVTSEHTISIPLRQIDGAWYLSTYGINTAGLTFVQSVQM